MWTCNAYCSLCLCTAPDTAPEGQRVNMKILSDDPKTGMYTYVRSVSKIAANGFSKGAERVLQFNGKCLLNVASTFLLPTWPSD